MEDKETEYLNDRLEKILDRQLFWIQSADSKAATVLPVSVAMLGAIAALAPKDLSSWGCFSTTLCAITSFLLLLSVVFLGLTTFPRTNYHNGSVIFFGGIVSKNIEDFTNQFYKLSPSIYNSDLVKQVYINAQIASKKHKAIKQSIKCLYIAVAPWALTVFILYRIDK